MTTPSTTTPLTILVTGGARSGKSRFAQALAEQLHPQRRYLATAESLDEEMADRIRMHQADRGEGWQTVEEPLYIAPLIRAHTEGVILLDCLTLWVSNLMHHRGEGADLRPDFDALADAVSAAKAPLILVTNEVGLGIVPMNKMAREFRDNSGWLSQRIAAACDGVALCVAGIPMWVKGGPPDAAER